MSVAPPPSVLAPVDQQLLPAVCAPARVVEEPGYREFAARVTATGILSDPWIEGRPRFRAQPILLGERQARALERAAEEVAAALNELAAICAADPDLTQAFFGLTPFQRLMWEASAPQWHGIARADVFLTDGGPAVCEINSDTPSGEAEAVILNAVAAADRPDLCDPNAHLGKRFCDLVSAVADTLDRAPGPLSIGILYPTELTEDLSMIALYRRWFEARGWKVVLGSPFNLRRHGERRASLLGTPCDVLVRHYKTDWWGERLPIWDDEEAFSDPEPLAAELGVVLGGVLHGGTAVVNPFGAVLVQNKRAMAFLWEEMARLSATAQESVRRYLPYTVRLEQLDAARLSAERAEWVLKSDYGCEGSEVVVGAESTQELWDETLRHALPRRWVAQRYFRVIADASDPSGVTVNYGVYLVGGEAAGFLSRVQKGATDYHALMAPTLIRLEHPRSGMDQVDRRTGEPGEGP